MRRLIGLVGAMVILTVSVASAQVYVSPTVRRDGTYVPGHMRTAPDGNRFNNWSTRGNANPYTGERGTVNPYAIPRPSYGYGGYGYRAYGR